jgi:DNA mismatch repair protein MutL
MSNLIKLLPDSVANQIAAGEVVQRPASAVKELIENAIDAGATSVQLIVKDAGRTLIQVIDNGCGMSETDARMCFERHATSKIKETTDLFNLRTKGFRGEAMASIAAVAQVEMRTKLVGDDVGVKINIEGSKIISQEPIQTPQGTSISVKNLFFNIPARRNFLKSNAVEMRHIVDEFERVALTHPDVEFKLISNDSEMFNLQIGSLRQRIVAVFGKNFNQKLVPLNEDTTIVNLTGFIGKPEFAKKKRGEQFFFVNKRFIKSNYLNHAIMNAYKDLIPHKSYPSYFIYMEVDPSTIDINIHPTKTEIKFEDEKSVYAIISSAIKKSIGQYQVAPSLDFEAETSFNVEPLQKGQEIKIPQIKVNPEFNPFEKEKNSGGGQQSGGSKISHSFKLPKRDFSQQSALTDLYMQNASVTIEDIGEDKEQEKLIEVESQKKIFQIHNKYIFSQLKSGYILIDQQRAHERVLYERFLHSLSNEQNLSQQQLFPVNIEFTPGDFAIISEIWEEIKLIGFDIEQFGNNAIAVNGIPSDLKQTNIEELFEKIIEQFKNNSNELKLNIKESVARAMAKNMAVKAGKKMTSVEIETLVDQLFACETPYYSPTGKKVVVTITLDDLEKQFE